jgi:hypothetical protein
VSLKRIIFSTKTFCPIRILSNPFGRRFFFLLGWEAMYSTQSSPGTNERRVSLSAIAILAGLLGLMGCGGPAATVSGRVTCRGIPVVGGIVFSPKGEDERNKGPAVPAQLKEDGSYEVRLTTIGKHTVVVTPRDVKFPVPPGEFDYPCDRTPLERDVKAGDNDITIELAPRRR